MAGTIEAAYAAAPWLRHAEVAGCRVILDLRVERYRVLNQAASMMWCALTGESSVAGAIEALSATYQVEESRLISDLETFARQCLEGGLLTHAGGECEASYTDAQAVRHAGPSIMLALYSLVATARSVRRHGFAATYKRYERLARGESSQPGAKALRAFSRAENLFVAARAPDDCLVRSLALFRFLNRSGCRAVHVIGVQRFPFRAHAWVECDGQPALQSSVERYTPLARI